MAKKRRVKHSKRKVKIRRPHKKRSSRLFLLGMVLLIIISIIILFNPNATNETIGKATFDTTLSKTTYDIEDILEGSLKLEVQKQDILPGDVSVKMQVFSKDIVIPKCGTKTCPSKYLCANGETVSWMFCNMTRTPKRCENVSYEEDGYPEYTGYPEKLCCALDEENCDSSSTYDVIDNSGFEESLTGNWIASKTGNSIAEKVSGGYEGSYSGKTDTSSPSLATGEYAKFTQTFTATPVSYFGNPTQRTPPVTVEAIRVLTNPLKFAVKYEVPSGTETRKPYSFELVVKSSQGRNLHYYFDMNNIKPADTSTDKYITIASSSSLPQQTWKYFELNLYGDWKAKGLPITDSINKVELISHGKKLTEYSGDCEDSDGGDFPFIGGNCWDSSTQQTVNDKCVNTNTLTEYTCAGFGTQRCTAITHSCSFGCETVGGLGKCKTSQGSGSILGSAIETIITYYGQKAFWDEITLQYGTALGKACTDYGKECCTNETGLGNYYGNQLSCAKGTSCFDACTEVEEYTLEEFIALSTTPDSANYTDKDLAFKSGTQVLGGRGRGYAYCFETNNEDDNCFGWNNIYNVDLETLEMAVPPFNGEYTFFINVSYRNYLPKELTLDTATKDFTVGTGSGTLCPDSDYTFTTGSWGSWSDCSQQGRKTRTRTLYGVYDGSHDCPDTKNKTETEEQNCTYVPTCTPQWEWQECIEGESQYKEDIKQCDPNKLIDLTTERDCCIESWQCSSWGSCSDGKQTRTCSDNNDCDTEFSKPEETRTCEKPSAILALWWLWLLIVLIGVFVVLFATKVIPLPGFLKGKAKKSGVSSISGLGISTGAESNELTGYIEQALNYGLSKSEIEQKLKDAGWPQDSIDKAFRSANK